MFLLDDKNVCIIMGELVLKKFYLSHKGVSIGFVCSIVVILFYLLTLGKEDIGKDLEKWLNVLFQVGVGYIINFLFYITQVYLPQIKEEEKAFALFEADLYGLSSSMERLYNLVEAFVNLKGDVINYKRGIICFKNELDDNEKFYHVNIDKALKRACSNIDDRINKVVNNKAFMFCNKQLIYSVSEIQLNGFTKVIYSHAELPDDEFKMLKIAGAEEIYKDFVELYEKIAKYSSYERRAQYKELNEEELREYLPTCIEQQRRMDDYINSFKTDSHNKI